jgi:ABC-type branched-subunit amino acid transport system substrate-binding protein
MDQVKTQKVQLVYLISSDPKVAKTLVQAFLANFSSTSMPVLVGQAGGFASLDFLNSSEAQNMFILRQQLVANNCPPNVKSIYEAQSYASIYLLDQAVKQVLAQKNVPTQWFSPPASISAQSVAFREKVRNFLKDSNLNLPCLGQVAFDNTGQNKLLHLEMIKVHQGQTLDNQVDSFAKTLKLRLQFDSLP